MTPCSLEKSLSPRPPTKVPNLSITSPAPQELNARHRPDPGSSPFARHEPSRTSERCNLKPAKRQGRLCAMSCGSAAPAGCPFAARFQKLPGRAFGLASTSRCACGELGA